MEGDEATGGGVSMAMAEADRCPECDTLNTKGTEQLGVIRLELADLLREHGVVNSDGTPPDVTADFSYPYIEGKRTVTLVVGVVIHGKRVRRGLRDYNPFFQYYPYSGGTDRDDIDDFLNSTDFVDEMRRQLEAARIF